ncbi:MAG: hypothetical protein AAGA33_02115 [Pseudomonadota bacterium]
MEPTDTSDGTRYYEAPESNTDSGRSEPRFYCTGPIKFVLMYFATFGLYAIYWSYRNWRFIRERDQSGVMPILSAIFYVVTFYWYMKSLAPSLDSTLLSSTTARVLLAIALYGLAAVSALPDPYWLVSLLGFVVLLPVVLAMASTARTHPERAERVPVFHWSNALAYLIGLPILLLAIT